MFTCSEEIRSLSEGSVQRRQTKRAFLAFCAARNSLSLSLSLSLFSFFSFATIFLTLFSRDISEGEVFQMEIPIARQVAVWKTEIDRRAGVFILRRYSTYILHIFSGSSIEREANVENEKEGEEERRRKKRESTATLGSRWASRTFNSAALAGGRQRKKKREREREREWRSSSPSFLRFYRFSFPSRSFHMI